MRSTHPTIGKGVVFAAPVPGRPLTKL